MNTAAAWDPAWDAATLDREYSPSSRVPSLQAYLDAYAADSAAARREHEVRQVRYGPHPAETVDVFPARRAATGQAPPLHVFVHGGNWQILTAAESAFPAPGFLRRGVAFAAVDYALAPAVTLDEIVAMVRRCLHRLPELAGELGFDPARIQVSGASAGAHLVAMALLPAADADPPPVAGVALLSGMYDLEPVRRSYVNDALRLDAAAARRNSPVWLPASPQGSLPPVVLARGGNETEGYALQHDAMLAALRRRGADVVDVVDPARNHFDLPYDLADGGTPLGAAVLAQIGARVTAAPERARAVALDAADPLAGFRERFVVDDPDLVYLDGNSLGRLPAATPDAVAAVVREQWGGGLVRSWHSWIDWGTRLGDRLAEHVLGARPGEVVVADSTSVNLYKLAAAALDAAPGRGTVVVDAADFPTDRYVVQGLARQRGLALREVRSDVDAGLSPDVLRGALDEDVALLVLSAVSYRSGALLDLAAVEAVAADVGARVLWDVSHAAGVVPLDLAGSGAALAVGCTYKYLNGGPGAPAFLYVRQDLQAGLRQPIWGWFGQRDQFRMGPEYDPVDGIGRFCVGTPPVLALAALQPALDLVEEAGLDRLREKSVRQGELVAELAEEWLVPLGFRLASPRDPRRRGGHVALEHPDAWRICRALAADAGVVADYRVPDRLRLGPSPLYTRYVDVWDALERIRDLVAAGGHERFPHEPPRVT